LHNRLRHAANFVKPRNGSILVVGLFRLFYLPTPKDKIVMPELGGSMVLADTARRLVAQWAIPVVVVEKTGVEDGSLDRGAKGLAN